MAEMDRVMQLTEIQNEACELFRKKNADYGDAFATYGTVGILVRLGDKISRLQSITNRGINLVEDEKLRDTLIDLHNYAAMGIMLLDETSDRPESIDVNLSELVLEENKSTEEWEIKGSKENTYTRRRITNACDGSVINTCSCPSFIWCQTTPKTCKHID